MLSLTSPMPVTGHLTTDSIKIQPLKSYGTARRVRTGPVSLYGLQHEAVYCPLRGMHINEKKRGHLPASFARMTCKSSERLEREFEKSFRRLSQDSEEAVRILASRSRRTSFSSSVSSTLRFGASFTHSGGTLA